MGKSLASRPRVSLFIGVVVLLVLFLFTIVFRAAPADEAALITRDEIWELAKYGKVEGRTYGSPEGKPAIVLHGMAAADEIVWEWERAGVCSALAAAGYFVVAPNLHSNPMLAPKVVTPSTIDAALEALTSKLGFQRVVLLGKSWGGATALRWAANHPQLVDRLVLCAPATRDSALVAQLTMPLWLGWCKDDSVVLPLSNAETFKRGRSVTYYEAEVGGHAVIPEFSKPIVQFLQAWRIGLS